MNGRLLRLGLAVALAAAALEGLQHVLMLRAPMMVYHVVSALLTFALVALAGWLLEARLRLADATARASALAQSNHELQVALRELERSDRLAALGAATRPLVTQLRALLNDAQRAGQEPALIGRTVDLLRAFEAVGGGDRRGLRPVDLAGLVEWVAEEMRDLTGEPVSCVRPGTPVWVQANPGRLEVAVRHFIAEAAERSGTNQLVLVLSTSADEAALVLAGGLPTTAAPSTWSSLSWRLAQAIMTECGGAVAIREEEHGFVYTLRLPLGHAPATSYAAAA